MACTRDNPCGAVLYMDAQNLELALAGIPRRVHKCLAGHAFWEGEVPTDDPAHEDAARTPAPTATARARRPAARRRARLPAVEAQSESRLELLARLISAAS